MKSILLVEDDDCLRDALKRRLEHSGYPVTCAANGREAIEAIKGGAFDLVATDIFMPQESGLAVIMHLRAHMLPCKILAFSGGGSLLRADDYLDTARVMKVDGTLRKPFTGDEFVEKIGEVLA